MSVKLKGIVDEQIRKIEALAKQKEEELERVQYEKYHELFALAVRAIKRERIMMYGGTAINDLLPPKLQFYPPTKLPDIDVLTVDAEKVAKRVVRYFMDHGHKITSYAPALHPGTFKVYLNGLQVLDITAIPDRTFRHLVRRAVMGPSGLRIVDPEYLRMTLHMMLAQSNDAYRWTKNFERMLAFYKAFPPPRGAPAPAAPKRAAPIPDGLLRAVRTVLAKSEYVILGEDAPKGTTYLLTRDDVAITAGNLADQLVAVGGATAEDFAISEVYDADGIVQDHVFLTYKGHRLLAIYHAHACLSYVVIGDKRMASIHTLIAMYMMMSLTAHSHSDRAALCAIANHATQALLREIRSPTRKKELQQFVLECYGKHTGVVTLRREALIRRYGKKI